MTLLIMARQEIVFWLSHRWRGHRGDVEVMAFGKSGNTFAVRCCVGCGRVYPGDVEAACDAMDAEYREA